VITLAKDSILNIEIAFILNKIYTKNNFTVRNKNLKDELGLLKPPASG
jgi:hypothetical protein